MLRCSEQVSNLRPLACKASALPTELSEHMVRVGGLEPPTSTFQAWRSTIDVYPDIHELFQIHGF